MRAVAKRKLRKRRGVKRENKRRREEENNEENKRKKEQKKVKKRRKEETSRFSIKISLLVYIIFSYSRDYIDHIRLV